jgi:hypothetical protein
MRKGMSAPDSMDAVAASAPQRNKISSWEVHSIQVVKVKSYRSTTRQQQAARPSAGHRCNACNHTGQVTCSVYSQHPSPRQGPAQASQCTDPTYSTYQASRLSSNETPPQCTQPACSPHPLQAPGRCNNQRSQATQQQACALNNSATKQRMCRTTKSDRCDACVAASCVARRTQPSAGMNDNVGSCKATAHGIWPTVSPHAASQVPHNMPTYPHASKAVICASQNSSTAQWMYASSYDSDMKRETAPGH